MHKMATMRSWSNHSEGEVSYCRRLDEAEGVFVTSLVHAVLNLRVLQISSAGTSVTVTVEDQRSYIRTETLYGKNRTEIHSVLNAVRGKQTIASRWATRFHDGRVGITLIQGQKDRQMNSGRFSLTRSSRDITSCQDYTSIRFRILTNDLQKRKSCARWIPHSLTAETEESRHCNINERKIWRWRSNIPVSNCCCWWNQLKILNQRWNPITRVEKPVIIGPKNFDGRKIITFAYDNQIGSNVQ